MADAPPPSKSEPAPKPPVLDYPSPQPPAELDSEPWPQVIRAILIVLGILGAGSFIVFGCCGVVLRGCQ